jgi:hypothetical protein
MVVIGGVEQKAHFFAPDHPARATEQASRQGAGRGGSPIRAALNSGASSEPPVFSLTELNVAIWRLMDALNMRLMRG